MNSSILRYFKNGFKLANKNIILYLIGVVFSSTTFIYNTHHNALIVILYILLVLITAAFQLSLPVFLAKSQKDKLLDFKDLIKTVVKQARRLIVPAIILIVSGPILILLISIIILFATGGRGAEKALIAGAMQNIINLLESFNLVSIVLVILGSFFTFVPIYFSLEEKGFFKSIIRSVIFCAKHLNFLIWVILMYVLCNWIFYYNKILVNNSGIFMFMRLILMQYLGFIVSATSLLFYHDKNKPQT